jgi:hypothetical protein
MRSRNLTILCILCLSLMLRADSCLVEQKDVALIIPAEVPYEWETRGYTEATGTDSGPFDAAGPIRDGLESDTISGTIVSVQVSGVQYRVTESTGHDAQRFGFIEITFDQSVGTGHDVGPYRVLDFDVPTNVAGTTGAAGDGTVTLNRAGVDELNYRLGEWLTTYNADTSDTSLDSWLQGTWGVSWTSDPPPTSNEKDNFKWVTDLVVQVEKNAKVDAPK